MSSAQGWGAQGHPGHPPLLPPRSWGAPWALTPDPYTSGLDQGSQPHTALLTRALGCPDVCPSRPEASSLSSGQT